METVKEAPAMMKGLLLPGALQPIVTPAWVPQLDAKAALVTACIEKEDSLLNNVCDTPASPGVDSTPCLLQAELPATPATPAECHELCLEDETAVHTCLPQIPTHVTLDDGTQITLSPVLWRDYEAPHRLMVNVGLRTIAPARPVDEAPSFYATMNPRIVTTGVPPRHRRHHPYKRSTTDAVRTRSGAVHLDRSTSSPAALAAAGSSALRKDREASTLEDVWLLRCDPRHPAEVVDSFRCQGPFEGTTVPQTPDWAGDSWRMDIVAKVIDCEGGQHWMKALHRTLQSVDS